MARQNLKKSKKLDVASTKSGFSVIEVMLVLAITGLMLVGILGGSYTSITRQRYTDAVRSFAEYLRTNYSEVISPEGLGAGNSNTVILGKAIVFSSDSATVYAATIIGSASLDLPASSDIVAELNAVGASLYCGTDENDDPSTSDYYTPLWQAEFREINDAAASLSIDNRFTGTIIVSRAPSSGTVHTAYARNLVYDLKDKCTPSDQTASNDFARDLDEHADEYNVHDSVGICLKSEDSPLSREIRIAPDGRNTSAISIIDTDTEDNRCL